MIKITNDVKGVTGSHRFFLVILDFINHKAAGAAMFASPILPKNGIAKWFVEAHPEEAGLPQTI